MATKNSLIYETRSNQTFLRSINTKKVLNLLWMHKKLSRLELAQYSRLNKKTITNIVNPLLEDGIVAPSGFRDSDAGRRQELLELVPSYSYHMGLDVGATQIQCVIVDFCGNVIAEQGAELRVHTGSAIIMQMAKSLIESVIRSSGLEKSKIKSLGFSVPGFVDRERGVSHFGLTIPDWQNIPVRDILKDTLDVPFYIEDSSRAMAIAEYRIGAGRGESDFILFDLGYGVGCGIFIDGQLYMGSGNKSGEIGHTIVKPDGPMCERGHRGCIESIASGMAIANTAKKRIEAGEQSLLTGISGGEIAGITARDVVMASELGDELSCGILREAGEYLAIGVVNALHFFNPSLIILGGRLMASGNVLLDTITKFIKENTVPMIYDDVRIVRSEMGSRNAALGAALLHLEDYFDFYPGEDEEEEEE